MTVDRGSAKSLIPVGTQVSLAVGAAGQTVRLKAEACATGTGSALVLTVKQVELRAVKAAAPPATTGTTETGTIAKKHEQEHGKEHGHKGATTTATTTTAATTTGTTTTTPKP